MKRLTRRSHFPLDDPIVLTIDVDRSNGAVDIIVIRDVSCVYVHVDELNPTRVDIACKTWLIRTKIVDAKRWENDSIISHSLGFLGKNT